MHTLHGRWGGDGVGQTSMYSLLAMYVQDGAETTNQCYKTPIRVFLYTSMSADITWTKNNQKSAATTSTERMCMHTASRDSTRLLMYPFAPGCLFVLYSKRNCWVSCGLQSLFCWLFEKSQRAKPLSWTLSFLPKTLFDLGMSNPCYSLTRKACRTCERLALKLWKVHTHSQGNSQSPRRNACKKCHDGVS